ncbi:magnesium/cobalt transporter CorA [Aquincola tertiaricarbonis]|uniref:magnesium/cobalt transporter CorA n=1 Tax=Aquincola tertiaricarbonis TaxID=391953 RepID=UPI000614B993|nr:magnesium/cobalt transporter CorA [Aquincola tertiaricarbonis]
MLVNCVAYRRGVKVADIAVEAISDHLDDHDTFVWVALKDATVEELRTMQHEFNLHDVAVDHVVRGNQRPKIELYGSCLYLSMQLVEQAGSSEQPLRMGEVSVFAGPNFVLSVRNHSQLDFLGVRRRTEAEPELLRLGAGFVLYALMDSVVDRYFPVVDFLESELERIENDIFSNGSARSNVERLYHLKRRVMELRRAVAPLREALGELQGPRVPAVAAPVKEYLRDVLDHLSRINASIDSMRETVNTAIQVTLSMTGIEENTVAKRLASWAAIFAVWTALAGVWGMNFEFMPELRLRYGYAMALAVMAAACGTVYWRFRRAGWL